MSRAQVEQTTGSARTDRSARDAESAGEVDPARDAESAWLAAFALGLVYSGKDQGERVHLLREATQERPELLAAAEERLETVQLVEPELRDQARRLLDRARTLGVAGAIGVTVSGE